jgi:hypothetical protein
LALIASAIPRPSTDEAMNRVGFVFFVSMVVPWQIEDSVW